MGKLIYDGDKTTDAKTAKAKEVIFNFFGQSIIESNKARWECVCVCACTPQ